MPRLGDAPCSRARDRGQPVPGSNTLDHPRREPKPNRCPNRQPDTGIDSRAPADLEADLGSSANVEAEPGPNTNLRSGSLTQPVTKTEPGPEPEPQPSPVAAIHRAVVDSFRLLDRRDDNGFWF